MNRPLTPDLQETFTAFLTQLRQSFGEDLLGVYALVQDTPHVIAAIEKAMTREQRTSLEHAYLRALKREVGLTVFTIAQFQQGHPYEADFHYDAHDAEGADLALANTARLRALQHRGHVLGGPPIKLNIPPISNDEYRVALQHEADQRLARLHTASTEAILHLGRILAFWRIGLVLPIDEVGAWSIKNLDPRFQALIERASIEHQSGSEPSAYNSYQLDQFAEYVRDMMRR